MACKDRSGQLPFNIAVRGRLDCAELGEEEGVVEGDFFEVVVAAGGSAVAGVHVDVEEERRGVGFDGAEAGYVFGGLPVHDL